MQCSRRLLGLPGFWKRSLDQFTTEANKALTFENLKVPTRPYPLITFSEPSSIELCKHMSDADLGAFSTAHLDFVPESGEEPPHAHFHGTISIELPPRNPEVVRTGYAGWRTLDPKRTLFGKSLWDISPYNFLGLRIKSDGRKYFLNLQTDSIIPTDLHQHRVFSKRPGEWETLIINIRDFVRTNHGMVVEPQSDMLDQSVKSVGISLIDRVPKPYSLKIAGIWATNDPGEDADSVDEETPEKPNDKPAEPEKILI